MHTTSKHRELRQTPIVEDSVQLSGRDLADDLSDPAELKSWSIEELDDFLPSYERLATDDVEAPWGYSDSLAPINELFD